MTPQLRSKEVEAVVDRIRAKMRPWGITVTFLASQLGVSRQYAWQIVHNRSFLSVDRALEIERVVDTIISQKRHLTTFGERLRAARVSAGYTLKQVAELIGYSWVGVERWEKNVCLPKPGVLWHLFSLYGVTGDQWQAGGVRGGGGPRLFSPRKTSVDAFPLLPSRQRPHPQAVFPLQGDQRKRAKSNKRD
jgi:transcriptional regulator with XRE-family HTH domain